MTCQTSADGEIIHNSTWLRASTILALLNPLLLSLIRASPSGKSDFTISLPVPFFETPAIGHSSGTAEFGFGSSNHQLTSQFKALPFMGLLQINKYNKSAGVVILWSLLILLDISNWNLPQRVHRSWVGLLSSIIIKVNCPSRICEND
jgi:hypothetical protein